MIRPQTESSTNPRPKDPFYITTPTPSIFSSFFLSFFFFWYSAYLFLTHGETESEVTNGTTKLTTDADVSSEFTRNTLPTQDASPNRPADYEDVDPTVLREDLWIHPTVSLPLPYLRCFHNTSIADLYDLCPPHGQPHTPRRTIYHTRRK